MKKINTVIDSKDFEEAIHKGKLFKNKDLILYIIKKDNKYYRFGISVGKKISKRAVDRNLLKRRLKSIIDNNKKLYQNNLDYIIIMKKTCLDLSYQELENSFLDIIKKVKIKGENNE